MRGKDELRFAMEETIHAIRGRESELAEIRDFVESAMLGPSALILEGAAGIGKSILWRAGLTFARDRSHRVLFSRPGESEARLSYGALGDILDFELPDLPPPQKKALNAALLRADVGDALPDQRAVSLASLGVLRAIAASGPVIIAVDDIQWLDAPSAKVLSFIARRLEDQPIRILVTLRSGSGGDPLGLARTGPVLTLKRLRVEPLSEQEMTRLLSARTGGKLTHPTLRRLHRISQGNPFFALEIARALTEEGITPHPGEPLPVPEDLQHLLRARLASLPPNASDALLVVAAATRPTEELVVAVADGRQRASPGIRRAEKADIIKRGDGWIGFTHPLLGSTVYTAASSETKRRVHRRLAELVDDPEERARHLALATSGSDEHVAGALDMAARHARARGAPDAAAELSELARRLTPSGDDVNVLRRSVESAEHHFDAGDANRAREVLETAMGSSPPGPARARILFRLGSISWMNIPRVQKLCEQALREARNDSVLEAAIHEHLAWVGIYRGELSFAAEHAKAAGERARKILDPAIRSEVISTQGMVDFLMGRPAQDLMAEAVRLADRARMGMHNHPATVYTAARTCYGLQLMWAGELDAAREILLHELTQYESAGRYVVRDEILCYLAELESRAGNWDVARRYAVEAVDIGADSGHVQGRGQMLFPRALVEALLGDVEAARSDATEGLRISLRNEDLLSASCNRAVLGFLELSMGNPGAAIDPLEAALGYLQEMGSSEPGIIPCVPDAVEAMIAVGRLDEAEGLIERLSKLGQATNRPWALAAAARCRGLLAGARGELSAAHSILERALIVHGTKLQPFELARTLLVKGDVERRAKQKLAARSSLEQAFDIFSSLGARLWAAKAWESLARAGGTVGKTSQLTPTEQRIARLVGDGKKNREVADALFISIKTVESNLSRIYHKLGVRSRTELARLLATPRRK